jgi:hypothetical protein
MSVYAFGGEDATLIYYCRCDDCGTIILTDHSKPEALEPWECPTCKPSKNFPFKYFTRDELKEDRRLGKLVGRKATLGLMAAGYVQ